MNLIINILLAVAISIVFNINAHANSLSSQHDATPEGLKKAVKSNSYETYACVIRDFRKDWTYLPTKPYKYPFEANTPYYIDNSEMANIFKKKWMSQKSDFVSYGFHYYCDMFESGKKPYDRSTTIPGLIQHSDSVISEVRDFELGFDYTKDVFIKITVSYSYINRDYKDKYGNYGESTKWIVSNSNFMKEIPLNLSDADYSKIHEQLMNSLMKVKNNKGEFHELADIIKFDEFRIYVTKEKKDIEFASRAYYDYVEDWIPEFASKTDETASKKSKTKNTQNKSSLPTSAPNNSEAVQKAEQEKIIKAEIKKEVAVAQVENKAQLTQDKALPFVKKVDDDVQKALKKIPKKEKKKVELKPYLETVVVCTPPSERGSFKCYGPNGSFSGHPNQPKGW